MMGTTFAQVIPVHNCVCELHTLKLSMHVPQPVRLQEVSSRWMLCDRRISNRHIRIIKTVEAVYLCSNVERKCIFGHGMIFFVCVLLVM